MWDVEVDRTPGSAWDSSLALLGRPFLIRERSVNPGTSQIPDLLSAEPFLSALTVL